jgi:hypothetical protein
LSRDTESTFGRHSGDDESPALTTPLSYKGTLEELDAELGRELAGSRNRSLTGVNFSGVPKDAFQIPGKTGLQWAVS